MQTDLELAVKSVCDLRGRCDLPQSWALALSESMGEKQFGSSRAEACSDAEHSDEDASTEVVHSEAEDNQP